MLPELREWWRAWWKHYNASVILVVFILISVVGFWRVDRADERLEAERDERLAAIIAQQTALAKHEADVAKQLAAAQIEAVRQANIDGCERDNQMRRRLHGSVQAQVQVIRGLEADTVARLPLAAFLAVMDAQKHALDELRPVNCEKLYPPVVPEAELN